MNKKKLILAITKSNMGGAQKYVFDLATNLKNDFEILVITGNNGLLNQKLKDKGIKNIIINIKNSFNPFPVFSEIMKLGNILKKKQSDIIHLNSGKMGLIGSIAAKLYSPKSKIIFTNHGLVFNEPNKNYLIKIILKVPYKIIFSLSHKIIAVSEAIRKDCISISKKSISKIIVIKNGIKNINFLDKKTARKKLSNNLDLDDFIIGTIAELHPVKGLKYLIEAMPKVILNKPNAKLVIIGEGKQKKELLELTDKLSLKNKIIFTGFIENASTLIKAFDIFIISSISEALAYTATESSLSEVPVISTNVGGLPEIIKDQETGILIEPKNSTEITKKILWVVDNYENSKQRGVKARKYILENFSFERFIQETKNLYL